jgi:hypothetical protein
MENNSLIFSLKKEIAINVFVNTALDLVTEARRVDPDYMTSASHRDYLVLGIEFFLSTLINVFGIERGLDITDDDVSYSFYYKTFSAVEIEVEFTFSNIEDLIAFKLAVI